MSHLTRLARNDDAASAAEFALVLPLFLLLFFGLIDAGRMLWQLNRAEKATQAGVRMAAVTDMIPSDLATYSFATGSSVPPGTPVPVATYVGTDCTSSGCTNVDDLGPDPGFDAEAFSRIGDRMRQIYCGSSTCDGLEDDDFTVSYRNVGLGYAGDPYGPDVAPQISISLTGVSFQPITTFLLATFSLPPTSSTISAEDSRGTFSN